MELLALRRSKEEEEAVFQEMEQLQSRAEQARDLPQMHSCPLPPRVCRRQLWRLCSACRFVNCWASCQDASTLRIFHTRQVGDVAALQRVFADHRQQVVDARSRRDEMRGSLATVKESVARAQRCVILERKSWHTNVLATPACASMDGDVETIPSSSAGTWGRRSSGTLTPGIAFRTSS